MLLENVNGKTLSLAASHTHTHSRCNIAWVDGRGQSDTEKIK